MHRDGDVTDGIMLRDGGSRNAVFRLFVFIFPHHFLSFAWSVSSGTGHKLLSMRSKKLSDKRYARNKQFFSNLKLITSSSRGVLQIHMPRFSYRIRISTAPCSSLDCRWQRENDVYCIYKKFYKKLNFFDPSAIFLPY